MKRKFQEYQSYGDESKNSFWNDALIILDTNVLLDFYCYGDKAQEDFYNVLGEAKKRSQIWMPYQVGFEFFENRQNVINKQLNQYDNLIQYLSSPKERISNLKNTIPNHPHLDFEEIAKSYGNIISALERKINRQKGKHPDYLGEDKVLDRIQDIYTDDLVGEGYSEDDLISIEKLGETRYEKKIPPGFRDQDKKESDTKPTRRRKYGDLIVWKQILDKAGAANKPIIFVTNDEKDDWVEKAKDGRKLGPLPALRKEILHEAGVDLMIYSADEFLQEAHTRFGLQINDESVKEVKKYREQELKRISTGGNFDPYYMSSYTHSGVGYPITPWDRRITRARMQARRILSIIDAELGGGPRMSERLMGTVNEIIGVYGAVRSHVRLNRELAIAGLEHNRILIRRAIRIVSGEEHEAILRYLVELADTNEQIIALLNQNEADEQTQLPMLE